MAKYTVRITNDAEGINAWIDQDGEVCIKQPHAPSSTEVWDTEAEAKAWADKHAADLEAQYEKGIAEETLKKEREEAAHQANLALVAILERLTNPTA
jgi:hypothetical protein